MKKRNDFIPVTAFDDDWLDKALAGVAILICIGIVAFLLYSFQVI